MKLLNDSKTNLKVSQSSEGKTKLSSVELSAVSVATAWTEVLERSINLIIFIAVDEATERQQDESKGGIPRGVFPAIHWNENQALLCGAVCRVRSNGLGGDAGASGAALLGLV